MLPVYNEQDMVGEVIEASVNDKDPLAYHAGKYWSLEGIEKPSLEELEKIKKLVEKFTKS